jgi:ribosomal protein L29
METHKLNAEEIRNWDAARRKEAADDIRRELVKMRMDIYTAKAQQSGKIRGLKKSLARLLTVAQEGTDKVAKKASKQASMVKAPKASRPVAAKAKPAAKTKTKATTKVTKGGKK